MRINKFLAHAGVASRRKIDVLIEQGKIMVNGKKAQLGQQIDPQKDEITVAGKKIQTEEKFEYIILNKPVGVASNIIGTHTKKTVLDLVKSSTRVYPVGWLDLDSKGLILLTNDGDLANRLIHPRYHVPKVYEVIYLGKLESGKIQKMEKGMDVEEVQTKEPKIKILESNEKKTILEITLFEGRKRQIRSIAEKLRLHILSLKRVAIGPIEIENLASGKSRTLEKDEIISLKKAAGL